MRFENGVAMEATTEELIQFAERSADMCKFEEFAESLFRLGQRGIEREKGLQMIKRFDKECTCHDHWEDYSEDPQDY